ncbi:hypothetical protein ACMC5O_000127 [Sphingomonas sediminicola]|uniref:hypothetical protein n=1 Tax=Sphingomonas sediminicola TaxID=386874 RepID=UPI003CEF433F
MTPARFAIAAIVLASAASALAAPPGSAQNFLDRANRLKAKGPLAFFDADYRRLKSEAYAAGNSLRDDRLAAQKTGKPILYCSPKARAQLGSMEFIDGLEAIPSTERPKLNLKQAMLRVLQKKYPCR